MFLAQVESGSKLNFWEELWDTEQGHRVRVLDLPLLSFQT